MLVGEHTRRDGHVRLRVLVAHLARADHRALVYLARARPLDLDLPVQHAAVDPPRLALLPLGIARLGSAAPARGG